MQIYAVGGAVRDELLGFKVKDKDFVVVGSSPETMIAEGFQQVGKDFPVFIHPKTHDEYALARTERKSGKGYKGFVISSSPEVTLEEDLIRRDLTINAIAKDSNGRLIDPYKGVADLHAKILRHVSHAFAEDPVRILRTARFAAKLPDFQVAQETLFLMQKMVDDGEVDALVPERVWQELAKGLMEIKPSRMFEVLRSCGALNKILPEIRHYWPTGPTNQNTAETLHSASQIMEVLDYSAGERFSLPIRFAVLMRDVINADDSSSFLLKPFSQKDMTHTLKNLCKRLRVPNDCKELACLVNKFHGKFSLVTEMQARELLCFLIELDAIRQPGRFYDFLKACESYSVSKCGLGNSLVAATDLILKVFVGASSVDAGEIAKQFPEPEKIKMAVFEARLKAVNKILLK